MRVIVMILILFVVGFVFAQEKKVLTEEELKKIDPGVVERQKIERKTNGTIPKEEKLEIVEQPKVQGQQEVIIRKYRPGILFLESSGFKMGCSLAQAQQQVQAQNQTQAKAVQEVEFKGYCEAAEDYKISLYPVPASLNCFIKNLGKGVLKLTGKFKPDIRQQLFLGFEDARLNGCNQLKNFSIVRLNDYSPNLYSNIDKKVIENALLRAGMKTGQDISLSVVERLKESERKTIVITEDQITITEKQKEDTWKDLKESIPYLTGANLMEALTREILTAQGGRIPPIFYVNKGELYYIEGVCVK